MSGPRCPNHKVQLIRTKDKGIGICPISSAVFTYTAVDGESKRKLNTAGEIVEQTEYKVEGSE